MSLLNVDTVEPEGVTTDLTLGAGGDKVVIPGTIKISGGSPGADKLLTSDADGDATWVAASSSGFSKIETPATGTASWVKPAGITKIIVEVQAGGGGGSSSTASAYGGNGGGGAYAKKFIDVTSIANADIVIGAAGAGGTAAGTAGGTSSFICTGHSISCTGGSAGQYSVVQPAGGAGGVATATGAFMIVNGQNGGQSYSYGDQGGGSVLGLGGMSTFYGNGNVTSYPGTGYGAGGPGGRGQHVSYYGAAGSVGIVIVWEYQ